MIGADDEAATGTLGVNIYRTDRSGPEFVQRVSVSANLGETRQELFDRGVLEVQKFLRQDWKARTIANAAQYNSLHVRVPYEDFRQWAMTQRALESVLGINDIVLESVSPKEARLELKFQGTEERIRLALRQADFTLSEPMVETFSVNNFYDTSPGIIYELYLNRFAPRPQEDLIPGEFTPSNYNVPAQNTPPQQFERRF